MFVAASCIEAIILASATEKYPPLPSRETHFPKQPELPSQQQLFILGGDQLLQLVIHTM